MSQSNYHNHVLYRAAQRLIDLLTEKLCLGNIIILQRILNEKLDAYIQKIQEETKLLDEEENVQEEDLSKKRKRA